MQQGEPAGSTVRCYTKPGCLFLTQSTALKLVRKGGFEPPRLSAPPPQDGVSASSTTSALKSICCRLFEGTEVCTARTETSDRQPHSTAVHCCPVWCALCLYTRSNEGVQVRRGSAKVLATAR